MNKKYFLKTFFTVLLFWKTALGNSNVMSSIMERQIFYDDEIESILTLQNAGEIIGTDMESLMNDKPNIVYTALKCKYSDAIIELLQTFFEINEYGINAPIAIQTSDIKKFTKEWLTTSLHHFNNIKPPIAKMIDSLLNYQDEYAELKTSDQSLLKSLLSINLFLYDNVQDCPFTFHYEETPVENQLNNNNDFDKSVQNFRKLNTSIIQMIGLVERFRSKRCVVRNPYKHNYDVNKQLINKDIITDTNKIHNLLNSTLMNLHLLVNNGSHDYTDFDSNMYDPEYLLSKNLLDHNYSFLEKVMIHLNGNESDLISKYNEIKRTYSIENILDFQYSLIKVIADIFYAQIYYITTKPRGISNNNYNTLIDLNENFVHFIYEMMPTSCSITVCNKILKAYYFFSQTLDNHYIYELSTESEMLTILRDKFKPNENKELLYQIIQRNFADDPYLSSLSHNILINSQHVAFLRVFNLLSYESHTNRDFYIVKQIDQTDISYSQSIKTDFLNCMIELQCALFAFRTLIRTGGHNVISTDNLYYYNFDLSDFFSVGFTSQENPSKENENQLSEVQYDTCLKKYGPIFANMLRVIVRLDTILVDKPDVQKILLPLLFHFRHADMNACHNYDFEFQVMYQISFVTINLVENYLIKNNLFPFYSLFIYSKLIVYNENGQITNMFYNGIHNYLVSDVQPTTFKNSLELLNILYDESLYDKLFLSNNEEIQYFWNGWTLNAYEIFRYVQRGVIDFNDLIGFHWFGIKSFVGKILQCIKKALSLLRYRIKTEVSDEIISIKNRLSILLELELPMSLNTFLKDMNDATVKIINVNSPSFDSDTCDKWVSLYDDNLEALCLKFEFENENSRMNEITIVLDSEIEKLKLLLKNPMLGTQNILISTELNQSPIENVISDKSIQILYDY